jgi:hypothetical protein
VHFRVDIVFVCAIATRVRRVGGKATTAKVAYTFSFAVALCGREYKRSTEVFSRGETEQSPPQKKITTPKGFATAEDRGRNRKENL